MAMLTYVVGVDAKLADRAIKPDQPLNPELWTVRKNPFSIPRAKGITVDGDLADWAGAAAVPLEKVRAKDDKTKAETYVSWNEEYLYAASKGCRQRSCKTRCIHRMRRDRSGHPAFQRRIL